MAKALKCSGEVLASSRGSLGLRLAKGTLFPYGKRCQQHSFYFENTKQTLIIHKCKICRLKRKEETKFTDSSSQLDNTEMVNFQILFICKWQKIYDNNCMYTVHVAVQLYMCLFDSHWLEHCLWWQSIAITYHIFVILYVCSTYIHTYINTYIHTYMYVLIHFLNILIFQSDTLH